VGVVSSLLPVDDALAAILARAERLPLERVQLPQAAGRVLAEAAVSGVDLPPFPSSSMDGFAVRAVDTPGTLRVVGKVAAGRPEMRVLGVHDASVAHEVVFVQVTNPASSSMRLTKLDYTFAAEGATVSTGEVALEREVPAGAAVVVEVPLDVESSKQLTLQGVLTAELDQIVRTFQVQAQIDPH